MSVLWRLREHFCLLCTGIFLLTFSSPALAEVMGEDSIWRMPRDVSLEGHRISWLIDITMVFLIILFVIMVVWMCIAIFKHNASHTAEFDHGSGKSQVVFALGLSTVIFVIVDGNLWVNSLIDLEEVFWNSELYNDTDAIQIEINAHQWAWDARYAGSDGEFNTADDIISLNDIRIPVDTPVVVQLASPDVIHSFNLPNLRIKQDAVPGNVTPLQFQAVETGEFDIACAQHCGAHHYKMKGRLIILSKEAYAAWATEASARGVLAYNPDDIVAHWGWPWQEF